MNIEIKKPTDLDLENLGVKNWPIWEKEESVFDWHYDRQEICFFLEGDVDVESEDGSKVHMQAGDMVTFPKGLSCKWHIKKRVKKHYNFE